jgi:hypothetical protein
LESEAEAAYMATVLRQAEALIVETLQPKYVLGTARVIVVFESPRAMFRMYDGSFMHAHRNATLFDCRHVRDRSITCCF